MTNTVWLGLVEQDIGERVVIPCATRGVCRQRVERFIRRVTDDSDFVEEWVEDMADGTSEAAVTNSGRTAIITERRVYYECDDLPVDLDDEVQEKLERTEP